MGSQNGSKKPINAKTIMQEKNEQEKAKKYNQYVENKTPKPDLLKDMWGAFWVGGIICTVGQAFIKFYSSRGFGEEDAAAYTTISLVLLSVLLTSFNVYQKITKVGGAGSLVPITGFANSVAAPAIEFGVEGEVYGKGCKIFTIAGPVILFGVFSSWVLGLVYWIGTVLGVG
jgi:stage V sporulation protein AC